MLFKVGDVKTYNFLDFHDDGNDARFCIRYITSVNSPDGSNANLIYMVVDTK